MASDPPPPGQPNPGTSWGSSPPPPGGAAPAELPRIGTAGSTGSGGRLSGREPASGMLHSASAGELPQSGRTGSNGGGIERSGSQGAIRPGSAGLGPRNPSREQLAPLPPGSPLPPATGSRDATPRSGAVARLAPLGASSRPGSSGAGSSRASGVPPLDLQTGATTRSGVPPAPAPHPVGRGGAAIDNNAATQRGPVKWVPHTHANPKHAKYCFICLHGRLEGKADGEGEDIVKQRMDEDDLPSALDMKEMAYLLPPGSMRFARTGADYEKDNITSLWLRDVSNKVYDETCKDMISRQNAMIHQGSDVGLFTDREDDQDRLLLERLFTLSDNEQKGVIKKLDGLAEWCRSHEARLQDVMPKPRERGLLPECEPPNETQKLLLEYKPLIDVTQLKGDTASDVRDTIRQADEAIGNKTDGEHFKASSLPKPNTYPDLPDFKLVPYPLSLKDVPKYEFTPPSELVRQPVDNIIDPFPRAFLHLPDFHESIMPEFKGSVGFGAPRDMPAEAAKEEEWLTKTRSIFSENNEEVEGPDWGKVPSRERPRVPLIDEPYQPPLDIVQGSGGHREIKVRGIWDPELLSTSGEAIPPIRERGKALYMEPEFKHPEKPIWSAGLAPMKPRHEKINSMCKPVPVRSFARFKPNRVQTEIPDFLWALAREDASGQNLWSVVEQRHDIPTSLRLEDERKAEEQRRFVEEEAANIRRTMEAEAEAFRRQQSEGSDYDPLATRMPSNAALPGTAAKSSGATVRAATQLPSPDGAPAGDEEPRAVEEATDGLPIVQMDAPAMPELPPMPTAPTAVDATTRPGTSASAAGASGASGPARPTVLLKHEERVAGLSSMPEEGTRSIEELITDDRFVESIADKIAQKLGGTAGSTMYPGGSQAGWAPGGGAAGLGPSGMPMAGGPGGRRMRPDPPSFSEPVDQASRAELPRALQGGDPSKNKAFQAATTFKTTENDVNKITMEKMRGDCYVRLLVKPEANAARKDPIPYKGSTVPPDTTLVMGGGRPNLRMPLGPPKLNEDDDLVVEDEFGEFEKDDSIVFSFVRHNRIESIESLIQSDTSILQAKDPSGNNLLHVACQNNNRRIAKMVLKAGIDVNEQNNRGNTALHYCYQYGFMPLCEYLVAHGADDQIPNHGNFMPAQGLGREDGVGDAQAGMAATGENPL